MTALYIIVFLVALQRMGEVWLANYNTKKLLGQGGIEVGSKHYPLFILLHGSWLAAILFTTQPDISPNIFLLLLFLILQLGRVWVIASLGKFWTTRIITMPSKPLIKKGAYRFIRHPNYIIVCAKIAVLPLVFGNWEVAVIWSFANAILLWWRIKFENGALRERRVSH